jgi:hypothetical protein
VRVDAATFSQKVNKTTVLRVLAEHPHWSLAEIGNYLESGGRLAAAFGSITVNDLRHFVDPHRTERERARRLAPPEFDALVLAIIRDAGGWVATNKVLARVGPPRWKIQHAFGRLVDAGLIERRGSTSSTRYRVRSDAS